MRLFISIPCSAALAKGLQEVQTKLRRESYKGGFPPLEKLHLTLVFLGETSEARLPELKRVLSGVSVPSFTLQCTGLGKFRERSGEIWWMGTDEPPGLLQLSAALRAALDVARFPYDRKAFRPHITLGRRVILNPGVHPMEWPLTGLTQKAASFSLMESCRLPDGKYEYRTRMKFPLA